MRNRALPSVIAASALVVLCVVSIALGVLDLVLAFVPKRRRREEVFTPAQR